MAEDVKLVMRYRVEANAPLAYQKPILLMEGDKRANVLQVSLFDGEKPVDVTGLTVGGSVLRADGADVAIEGEINGNVISCVLSEYAYAVAGPFKAYVQLLDSLGDVKRTVLLLAGMVESRGHGPQIDTGKELPSLDDILAQLETMRNVTQAANTATGDANAAAAAANSAASKATGAANSATTAAETANAAADRANDAAQNWESGTAANSSLLANKPPEYYLTPVNLLRNSDFSNPLNTNGYVSGTLGGANACIDDWLLQHGTSLSLENGFVRLSGPYDIWQNVSHTLKAGAAYTIAARMRANGGSRTLWLYAEDTAANRYAGVEDLNSGEWVTVADAFTLTSTVGDMKIHFTNSGDTSVATDIAWVALYEGTYTAESLPPYVPAHPRVESLKLGNPVQPVNLLDNSWFGGRLVGDAKYGLVYQAGLNGYHGTKKYPMDRWISWDADVKFADGYITPESPIDQHVANVDTNKIYTAAMKLNDGTILAYSGTFTAGFGSSATLRAMIDTNFSVPNVRIVGAQNVCWVALYEGAYTAETLPPYVPKPYAVELAECQRYYLPIITNPVGFGYAFSSGDVVIVNIPLPQPMRAIPTLPEGIVFTVMTVNGGLLSTSAYAVHKMAGNGLQVNLSGVTVPAGQPCTVAATDFSLNLDL